MTTKVKHSGAWTSLNALRFPYPGLEDQTSDNPRIWFNPSKVRVRYGGVWIDTGYVPVAGPPGTPYLVSGTPYSVVIGWAKATQQPIPTTYDVTLYTQAGVKVASARRSSTDTPRVTFGDVNPALAQITVWPPITQFRLTPDTNYYVTVTASGSGMTSITSEQLRIRTGHDAVIAEVPISGWLDNGSFVRPVAGVATSTYTGYPLTNTTDTGLPGTSGPLAPFSSGWVSKARSAQRSSTTPNDLWEGVDYTMPAGPRRRVKAIQVVCDQAHNVYLGARVANDWKGTLTASGIGISSTTYPTVLNHDYLMGNVDHTTNVKLFNVLSQNWEFTDVQRLSLAINNFVNIYGTPATSGTWTSGTQTQVTLPPYGAMALSSNRKRVNYVVSTMTVSSGLFADPDTGVAYVATPAPPAGAIWPNGATSGNYDYAITSGKLHFRPLTSGGSLMAYTDGCTFLRTGSTVGPVIGLTKEQVFTPALLGTTGNPPTYVSGTPSVPAWRARVLDVAIFFQTWGPTGKVERVTTTPAAATVAGPTAW